MTEWTITSSLLILIVTALRCILRGRMALRLQYALWALVLVRLLVPVSLGGSGLSIMNAAEAASESGAMRTMTESAPLSVPEQGFDGAYGEADGAELAAPVSSETGPSEYEAPAGAAGETFADTLPALLRYVWLAGAALLGVFILGANLSFYIRLRRSRRPFDAGGGPLRVYVTSAAATPCLFGLIRPAIYLTPEAAGDAAALRHVLAHERTHYRHLDHIWSLLRCLCAALHWYNPLVWLAAALSRRDAELACDEGAIRLLGEDSRLDYGRTLIGLSRAGGRAVFLTATTMTGSRRGLKERVTLIAKKPKTAAITLAVVLLAATLAVGCTFTGARTGGHGDGWFIDEAWGLASSCAMVNGLEALKDGAEVDRSVDMTVEVAFPVAGEERFIRVSFDLGAEGEVLRASTELDPLTPSGEAVIYEKYGLSAAIPKEYADLLFVTTEGEGEDLIISVFEKLSYDEGMADLGAPMGKLFSLCRYTPAQYEAALCFDSSGLFFFAKDDEYYYCLISPTDVQLYRSDGEDYALAMDDWTALAEGPLIPDFRADLIARNGLSPHSADGLLARGFTYEGEHVYVTYWPYSSSGGSLEDARTLVLSQPAAQGEGGIWCVERFYYDGGAAVLNFPAAEGFDMPAAEYFAARQAEADAGDGALLSPEGAALAFVKNRFQDAAADQSCVAAVEGRPAGGVLELCRRVLSGAEALSARDADGAELAERPVPGYYDMPLENYAAARLYPIIWLCTEEPSAISGASVVCRSADGTGALVFYEQDGLLCAELDGETSWFSPAYPYAESPYDRMLAFYEEFTAATEG